MHHPLLHPIAEHLASRAAAQGVSLGLLTSRTVVLVPYAQFMAVGRAQWAALFGGGFVPRFETTLNWTQSLAGFVPGPEDLSFDMAHDRLVAQALLERAGLASMQELLCGRVVEAAWQLASVARAQPPQSRAQWAQAMRAAPGLGLESPLLVHEAAVAALALVWVGASAYATDALFAPALAQSFDCLVVLAGLQTEPLTQYLKTRFADGLLELPLLQYAAQGRLSLHRCSGPEDEAERSAACVLRHLEAGRHSVALAATDRVLTRRISAMLADRGVALRDETGWALSTTRAAAQLMAALRACAYNAPSDSVIDWLKHSSAFACAGVSRLEAQLRRTSVRQWQDLPGAWGQPAAADAAPAQIRRLVADVNALRQPLQAARPLLQWLESLRQLLQASGQWQALLSDAAGLRVVAALRLELGAQQGLVALPQTAKRISLTQFSAWVNEVLERASFAPDTPDPVQVVVLPLAQLLGRDFSALVLPGCDEQHLPASPEPPGHWSATQRSILGLPLRPELDVAARAAFMQALQTPHCDLLWRVADTSGEAVLPNPWLQILLLDTPGMSAAADSRQQRLLQAAPTQRPQPRAAALLPTHLSASAYEDLRRCPYRFFALRQLGLSEINEMDTELEKRDFGTWLHAVLSLFHTQLQVQPGAARAALLDLCASQTTRQMSLSEAEFLPFSSAWPKMRDAYLTWLATHEALGNVFEQTEISLQTQVKNTTLKGRIDRIDSSHMEGVSLPFVLDYKTEDATLIRRRLDAGTEDTQLLFYAALRPEDSLRAAYVNVGEQATQTIEPQPEQLIGGRDLLIEGIAADMLAIAQGAALPALGEAPACDHCAARGLCRKDFWPPA